ncbi:MAG: MBOAT family protein [Nitriliruptorales bacterium]|nr:MBOAT family protein [Nitriliruptorales bacterium]
MLFPTIQFAVFFLLVLIASWLLMPTPLRWKPFMLAASYVFYAAWDWRFVGLLLAVTIATQTGAALIGRLPGDRQRRRVLTVTLVFDLGLLAWFKYYGFFATSLANLFDTVGLGAPLPLLQVILPVGISFFTFQAISYLVDVYRGRLAPARPIDIALYLAFFPQLVAGPIVRATEFLPQLRGPRNPRRVDGARGFTLIAGGLFKKVVVANLLATTLVDPVFSSPSSHSALEIIVAVYGYAVQIYADFSGYTDIAIGCALLLGFRFPDNFDRPYTAVSLQDFWRRWHMTLSRWLRDYLYIPLGGNAGGPRATERNLLITMVLGGLWHGAAWTFVVWGAIHGVGLALERRRFGEGSVWSTRPAVARLITFHIVCFGWVFFRADTFGTAATMLGRMITAWGPAPLVTPLVVLVIAGAIAVQFLPRGTGQRIQITFSHYGPAAQGATLALALLVTDALGPQGVAPFIYFQF